MSEVSVILNIEEADMAITKFVTVSLEVREAPDFFPGVAPSVLAVVKGALARFVCSITANSTFTSKVRLTATTIPPGAVASWDVNEIGVGEIATLSIDTNGVSVSTSDITIMFEEVV